MKEEKIILSWDINKKSGEWFVILCYQRIDGSFNVLKVVGSGSESEGKFVLAIPRVTD